MKNYENIKIAIIGANGKMGSMAVEVVNNLPNCAIVAKVLRGEDLDSVLKKVCPDIAIDFTDNTSVLANSRIIIANNVRPLIGTSGLCASEIEELAKRCKDQSLGGVIIPNFSLGVALVNKFALEMNKYFTDFSIIEFHHAKKKDKPSGTARYIANMLDQNEDEIASIRSDGFLAKLQLYANNEYERITIDHESFDRKSFIKGIEISIAKILQLNELVVGLENLI